MPRDGILTVWHVKSRKEVFHLVDREKVPNALAFSPDNGNWLAVGHKGKNEIDPDVDELRKKKYPLIVWNIARKKQE
ncbi:MAG: hypothetical protein RMJ82_15345, partial [Gemmatales bacterium]|nr:hypothetical protein [Gemmatales bacterium]